MPAAASLEIYPARDGCYKAALAAADSLPREDTAFVSVTCTGGNFDVTVQLCRQVRQLGLEPAAHMLCGGKNESSLTKMIEQCEDAGIEKIVALRGDLGNRADADPNPVAGTHQFVEMLARRGTFSQIMVSGYPDVHPDAANAHDDLLYLRRKVDAGAGRIITQFSYGPDSLPRFCDRLAAAGVAVPVSAGLLPIRNFAGMLKFAKRCRAAVPDSLHSRFAGTDADAAAARKIGREVLIEQTIEALQAGCAIHYYTLNAAGIVSQAWQKGQESVQNQP
ncbi:MAG: methylenetetrahydrofolate reductase [Betaproteobacteria bacterium]|nr:methylenetetrahydrofolate reductase [Betaproteobacteria bacterium]